MMLYSLHYEIHEPIGDPNMEEQTELDDNDDERN